MESRLKSLVAALVLILLMTACPGDAGKGADGKFAGLSGNINADGSSTVFPISQAVAEEFNREAGTVKISVGTSGTGGGFEKFCAGEIDIADASRPIKQPDPEAEDEAGRKGEAGACLEKGIEYVELEVALDGLSVLVHPENRFVRCLTVEDLRKIWGPNSTVNNWRQVRSGFPNRALSLYGPGTDSGTFDFFTQEVNGEEGASRSNYVASEDDNVLVQGIAGDRNALGYFGFGYFEQNKDKLKTVAVDGGQGCVQPTRESIVSGKYEPLSRPLLIYVAKKSAARPEVAAFVDFYLDTVSELVPAVGYVAKPERDIEQAKQKWAEFKVSANS